MPGMSWCLLRGTVYFAARLALKPAVPPDMIVMVMRREDVGELEAGSLQRLPDGVFLRRVDGGGNARLASWIKTP